MQTHKLIKLCSDTTEMEDVLTGFLKADALISAMEEKLEVMYEYDDDDDDNEDYEYTCTDCHNLLRDFGLTFSGPMFLSVFRTEIFFFT